MVMLKYPIGMQELPFWDKFGMDGPMGFLDEAGWHSIMKVLPPEGRKVLRQISDADPTVVSLVEWITSLPDLTESQINAQMECWRNLMNRGEPVLSGEKAASAEHEERS